MNEERREYDEQFITVEAAESAVIATHEWDGTTVEFSNDGVSWFDWWLPSEEHPVPRLARATVHRKGVSLPTVVTVLWEEYYPDDEPERAVTWDKLRTVMLSKVARMAAYRQAFRDVIGQRYEPAELHQAQRGPVDPERDWLADLDATEDAKARADLYREARRARAFTGAGGDELQARFAERSEQLDAAPAGVTPRDLGELGEAIAKTPKPGPHQNHRAGPNTPEGVKRERQRGRQQNR